MHENTSIVPANTSSIPELMERLERSQHCPLTHHLCPCCSPAKLREKPGPFVLAGLPASSKKPPCVFPGNPAATVATITEFTLIPKHVHYLQVYAKFTHHITEIGEMFAPTLLFSYSLFCLINTRCIFFCLEVRWLKLFHRKLQTIHVSWVNIHCFTRKKKKTTNIS